jgi:hypothetical protein
MGLEGRAQAAAAGDPEGVTSAPERPRPLVAAVLPALDAAEDAGSGRLLPRDAASQRDHHEQAGLLADAEPDLLLVECQVAPDASRHALDAVAAMGLPTWLALAPVRDAETGVGAMIDLAREAAVSVVLLPAAVWPAGSAGTAGPPAYVGPPAGSRLAWGSWLARPVEAAPELVAPWLEAGAMTVAVFDGATPAALAPLRDAIDAHERAEVDAAQRADERWWHLIRRAAAMAPGGRALWIIGERDDADDPGPPEPARDALPPGFEWLIVSEADARQLPASRVRLIVDDSADTGVMERAARLLEEGGCVALRRSSTGQRHPDLRLVVLDESGDPTLALLRKEG